MDVYRARSAVDNLTSDTKIEISPGAVVDKVILIGACHRPVVWRLAVGAPSAKMPRRRRWPLRLARGKCRRRMCRRQSHGRTKKMHAVTSLCLGLPLGFAGPCRGPSPIPFLPVCRRAPCADCCASVKRSVFWVSENAITHVRYLPDSHESLSAVEAERSGIRKCTK